MRSRFLIFALARTGSTTLTRVLNCVPGMKCINEPFNPDNFGGLYHSKVSDSQTLRSTLDELWGSACGIKHVWHPDGWPFADTTLNRHVLSEPNIRVVFLVRRNILRRVVSSAIAEQTRCWNIEHPQQLAELRQFAFKALDRSWIEWHIEREKEYIAEWRAFAAGKAVELLSLDYDDLFRDQIQLTEQLSVIERVCAFLGYEFAKDGEHLRAMTEMLDSKSSKIATPEMYRSIPNAEELDRLFGCEDTGRLL